MSNNNHPGVYNVRDIILEEGLDARNFVSWRVPRQIENTPTNHTNTNLKTPTSGTLNNTSLYNNNIRRNSNNNNDDITTELSIKLNKLTTLSTSSLRLYKLIYSNINRSINELYQFCEEENNIELCEESFQLFLSSCRDFALLTQKYTELKDKDNKDTSTEKVYAY